MARINIKPGRYGYTQIIQVVSTGSICVNYGEKPNGDIVIDSMNLGGPEDGDFHPAWLLAATREAEDTLREEMSVKEIQSLEDSIHRDSKSDSES